MKIDYYLLTSISKLFLTIFLIGSICSCKVPQEKRLTLDALKTLDKVDRIEITHRRNFSADSYSLKTIEDPKQIQLITQAFRSYADGWQTYYPYAPPALLLVKFYKGNEYQLGLMIGYTDNTSSGNLFYHLSEAFGLGKPLKEPEFKELMELLDIDEKLAYYN